MVYDIHIQLVNYNTKTYLEACIDGIINDLQNSKINYAISVLDNDSSDNLRDLEKKYSANNIRFYKSGKNLGFGGGHNFISDKEQAEFIVFVNPDVKFLEDKTIERLYNRILTDKEVAVIGPRMLSDNEDQIIYDHGEYRGLHAWATFNLGDSLFRKRESETESAWTCGAFLMIRKMFFEKVCGFDENFFLYVEEEDLCFRIRKLGGRVVYYPQVTILHHSSVVADKSEFYERSHRYFIEKHFEGKPIHETLKIVRRIYRLFSKKSLN